MSDQAGEGDLARLEAGQLDELGRMRVKLSLRRTIGRLVRMPGDD